MNLKDSIPVLATIFLYIAFFSVVGVFLFKDSYEGFSLLPGVSNAYYQLLMLLTTVNFPNVMLPAYNYNRSHCIFFILFLIMGLIFLFKVLLAVVFVNFKKRVEMRFEDRSEDRIKIIRKYFKFYDVEDRGVLQINEAKKFFALILDLDYTNQNDRQTFRKVMRIVGTEDALHLETVVEFF